MEGVSVLLSWLNHVVTYSASPSPNGDDYHNFGPSQQQQQSPQSSAGSISSGISAEVLHCIAAVLWNTPHDTTNLITDDLFRYFPCDLFPTRMQNFSPNVVKMDLITLIKGKEYIDRTCYIYWESLSSVASYSYCRRVYEWSERSEGEVKVGLDHIMCSVCHIRPQLFTQLLLNMSVLTVIDNNQSITDDRWDLMDLYKVQIFFPLYLITYPSLAR